MAKTREAFEYVRNIQFVGRAGGAIKTLRGFRKGRHTLPDAINGTTEAFLAKLCADELAEEAEAIFQKARQEFGYKRRDISLECASPSALLTTTDFAFQLNYGFASGKPSEFALTRTLQSVSDRAWIETPAAESVFGGLFCEIAFALAKGTPVESVIDAVEALDDAGPDMTVVYPSDYEYCVLTVTGVDAHVRFDGAELSMRFPRGGSPLELLHGFEAVRSAFALSKAETLSGLLG